MSDYENEFNELKSVKDLLTQPGCERKKFFIPAYQRGYRWNKEQATRLIEDLFEFHEYIKENPKSKEFYCLQPLVTTTVDHLKHPQFEGYTEVIDGQQRLTTLLLLFQAIHSLMYEKANLPITVVPDIYELRYETRESSEDWLPTIMTLTSPDQQAARDLSDSNCDYSHLVEVYTAIYSELKNKIYDFTALAIFADFIKKYVKFIPYEPQGNGSNNDVFDDINDGKISLNNAELIKALLVQKSNLRSDKDEYVLDTIAIQWDIVERRLQDKEFWGFIYSSNHPFDYDTHIEYILDLIYNKKKDNADYEYFTFDKVNKLYRESKDKLEFAKKTWAEILKMFNTLEEWYNRRPIYHRIGYLLEFGKGVTVNTLIESLKDKKKDRQIEELDALIKKSVKDISSSHLFHKSPELTKILFLYNVLAEDRRISSTARFSFADYKVVREEKGYDQEHIASNTDKKIEKKERKNFALDMIEYFCGKRTFDLDPEDKNTLNKKEVDFVDRLVKTALADDKDVTEEMISNLFHDILEYFHTYENALDEKAEMKNGAEKSEKDFIWNFVLLNAGTNRSYGNALYPVKRKRILNDEFQVYTPIGTRNVFEKAYSRKLDNMMSWTRDDAKAYWVEICKELKDYITVANFDFPFKKY